MRGAIHRPGFAVAVLLSLASGIGAITAVITLVDTVLVRPLPYPGADRVLGAWFQSPNFPGGLDRVRQSKTTYQYIRERSEAFESFALAEQKTVTVDDGTQSTRIPAAVVTADIFSVLQVAPAVGRAFVADDNRPGGAPTVILGHDYWAEQFGRSADAVGKTITIDGVSRQIVGVLPQGARFPLDETRLWMPLEVDAAEVTRDFIFTGYGRLREGASLEAATTDFQRLIGLLPDAYPSIFPRQLLERLQLSPLFVPLQQELVGDVRRPLLLTLLAVLIVLLIVVANVLTLFLVRNESKFHDVAIRIAIGAGPGRLARALITESLCYALVGSALGLALGFGALELLKRLGPGVIPRLADVAIGLRTVGAVAGLGVAVGLVLGLIPALRLRRANLAASLSAGGKTIGQRREALRLRWVLVAGQVALALTLLVNAGLLVRSLAAIQAVRPGFNPHGVLGARLYLSERDYPTYSDVERFWEGFVRDVRALPGVQSAAAVTFLPLRDGRVFNPYEIEGHDTSTELPQTQLTKMVRDGYFETMDIPLVRGRRIERNDMEAVMDVAVVNEAFARDHWPGEDPIGKRIRYFSFGSEAPEPWFEIVGIVGDVRDRELTSPAPPIVYVPMQERHTSSEPRWREMSLAIRATNPEAMTEPVRELVAARDRGMPVYDVRSMDQVILDTTQRSRYTMYLIVIAALASLFIAAVGLYGVLSQRVSLRRREMGLRLALGARPAQVRGLILGQALALAGAGAVVGIFFTFGTNRLLQSLLYGVEVVDIPTFGVVVLLLAAVTWMASHLPAVRAATVAPAITLKED
jgi:predicted permease